MVVTDEELYSFKRMFGINVNDVVEKKQNLTYLSWAWAWAETKKIDQFAVQKSTGFRMKEIMIFKCLILKRLMVILFKYQLLFMDIQKQKCYLY